MSHESLREAAAQLRSEGDMKIAAIVEASAELLELRGDKIAELTREVWILRARIAAYEAEPLAFYAVAPPEGDFACLEKDLGRLRWRVAEHPAKWGDCRLVALHAREIGEEVVQ